MTLPHEERAARRRANLLAMICQRREAGLPAPIRELAAAAFRHSVDPYDKDDNAAAWETERQYWLDRCLPKPNATKKRSKK